MFRAQLIAFGVLSTMVSFYVFLVVLATVSSGFGQDNDNEPSCASVKTAYRQKRLTDSDVPQWAVRGDDLRVCPKDNGKQCCSQQMEDRFAVLASDDFDKAVSSKVSELKRQFHLQEKAFDAHFRSLIRNSHQSLDDYFKKVYLHYYSQNSKIFTDFYGELMKYYGGDSSSDMRTILNKLFKILMQKMFQIMNLRLQFTDSYLQCVPELMDQLKPFGNHPQTLNTQLRSVLIFARALTKALDEVRDVFVMLENAISSKGCRDQLIKLKYCSWCKAMTSLKPCHKFCMDVHTGCLADIAKVNDHWQRYLEAVNELLEKLTGVYNIEVILSQAHIKMSFAIMNFQEPSVVETVKERVFQTCGKPDLTKRSTDDFFLEGNSRQRRESDAALPRKSSDVTLESLKADFKTKMKMADNYWTFLPEMLCSDIAGDKDEPSQCWNGTGKGSYSHPVDGRNAIEENPTPSVVKAIEKLKSIEKMIEEYSNAAVYGDDINIINTDDEDDEDESGSGSGDGSGGSASGSNEIPISTDAPTTDPINGIGDPDNDDMIGGGVGVGENPQAGSRNSASQTVLGAWLFYSAILLLCSSLVP